MYQGWRRSLALILGGFNSLLVHQNYSTVATVGSLRVKLLAFLELNSNGIKYELCYCVEVSKLQCSIRVKRCGSVHVLETCGEGSTPSILTIAKSSNRQDARLWILLSWFESKPRSNSIKCGQVFWWTRKPHKLFIVSSILTSATK